MSEPATETRGYQDPVEPVGEIARKNVVLGIALLVASLLIVAGTVVVSLIYLHYD